jgi:hypothetical protein
VVCCRQRGGAGLDYRRQHCSGDGELAGRLAGSGQTGPPATKSQGKTTKLKRRPRGLHLRARKGGKGAGRGDRGDGSGGRTVLRRWRGGGVEERKGGAREMQELEGILL